MNETVHDVNENKADALQQIKNKNIISVLSQNYTGLYYANLKERTAEVISISKEINFDTGGIIKNVESLQVAMRIFARKLVHPEDADEIEKLASFEAVYDCLRFCKKHVVIFRRNFKGLYKYCEMTIAKAEDEDDEPVNVIVGFSEVDEKYMEKLERNRESAIISELSIDFDYVGYVLLKHNKEDDLCIDYRVKPNIKALIPGWDDERSFHNRLNLLIAHLGKGLKTEDFYRKTRREVILAQLEAGPAYYINAKPVIDQQPFSYQLKITAHRDSDNKIIGFVVGIQSVNLEMQNEIEERTGTFHNMRVLLVDDDDLSREINADILQTEGALVRAAESAEEAIDLAKTNYFDVILMNLMMPGMSGLDAIKIIRGFHDRMRAEVPIIVLTAENSEISIEYCREAGADDCMTKPLIVSVLSNKYISCMKQKNLRIEKALKDTMEMANTDALTRVKNLTAYTRKVEELNHSINISPSLKFGMVICDINNLKQENDLRGHNIGDIYIKNCCSIICKTFAHSPVYRIGGDEFAAILQGSDYENRNHLMKHLEAVISETRKIEKSEDGKASLAAGLAVYEAGRDKAVSDVFKRADELMYSRKNEMKGEAQ